MEITIQKLQNLLEKYQLRKTECEEQFDEDTVKIKSIDETDKYYHWIREDMACLNAQIGIYECVIKDFKELLK